MVHEEIFPTKRGESIILDGQGIKAYDIRTITLGQLRLLIACGNDSRNNQIRVTKSGMVYLSEDTVGAEQLDDVAFSFETFLADLNEQAEERLDLIIEQMKAAEGVTKELKAQNQLEWVGRMNNIRNRAGEIINSELIYI